MHPPALSTECTGDKGLHEDTGLHTYDRAIREIDVDELAYGRRYPPHDVPAPPRRLPPSEYDDNPTYPPGFVPTGNPDNDGLLRHRHHMRMKDGPNEVLPPWIFPESDSVALDAMPPYPPLPEVAGFVPSGDPMIDERLLHAYLREHGTDVQRRELVRTIRTRWKAIKARNRLGDVRIARKRQLTQVPDDAQEEEGQEC